MPRRGDRFLTPRVIVINVSWAKHRPNAVSLSLLGVACGFANTRDLRIEPRTVDRAGARACGRGREVEGAAGAAAEGTGELVGAAFGGFKANRAERRVRKRRRGHLLASAAPSWTIRTPCRPRLRRVPSATPASRRSCIPGCLPADSPMPCKSPPGWRTGSLWLSRSSKWRDLPS
jgi:hypothetical protein